MRTFRCIAALVCMCGFALAADLDEYRATFAESLDRLILEHGDRRVDLRERYTESLDALRAKFQSAGDLDRTKAMLTELDRFKREGTAPAGEDGLLPELGELRAAYTRKLAELTQDHAKQLLNLASQYDKVLKGLQETLTRDDRLEEATAVQVERQAISEREAIAKAFAAVGSPAPAFPGPATGHVTVKVWIDGGDYLKVQGNRVWFEHVGAKLPGQRDGNFPTLINGRNWSPKWKGTQSEAFVFPGRALSISRPTAVTLRAKPIRGSIRIDEQPTRDNKYTLSIYLNDPPPRAAWYEFTLEW